MRANILRATNVVLGLLCLMYFLTYLDRVNISTAMASNQFLKEIPLTKTQAGLIFSAFAYPYLLFQISGGWVADKFGPRIALTICGIIWAGATIMMGLVHGLIMMFVARVVLGFGEGATFPTATRAMSYWMPKSKRGYAQGITHAFSRLGNSVTPWLVATLIAAISWRGSFIVFGFVSLFWALLWGLYFRNDPRQHRAITDEELTVLPPYAEKKGNVQVPWKRLGLRMIPVIFVYFCYGWTLWLFLSWIPSFFKNNYHLDLQSSALFASVVFFAGVLGDTLGGIVSDKLLERTKDLNIARRNLVAVMLPVLGCGPLHNRYNDRHIGAERGLLLRGIHDRSDVGHSDGHCAKVLGNGERHDEYRFGVRGNRFSSCIWLYRGQNRSLDLAIYGLDGLDALRRSVIVQHAS